MLEQRKAGERIIERAGPGFSSNALGGSRSARTHLARIDFQLGTNEAHLTGTLQALQALSRFFRRAAQYGVSLALWEEG